MSLFDATPYGGSPPAAPDPQGGPWRVEVFVPPNHWIPMDRIKSAGQRDTGKWTCDTIEDAIRMAQDWVDRGEVIAPRARVYDLDVGCAVWRSADPVADVVIKGDVL